MGQKINPTIFRLGINKTWTTEHYETKKSELPFYTFQSIEIIHYIEKFLKNNGLLLHSYKIHYNQSVINIYISYYIPVTLKHFKISSNTQIFTTDQLNKKLHILKFIESLSLFTKKKHKISVTFKCTNKNFYLLTSNDLTFLERKLKLLRKFRNKESFNFDETFNLMCNAVLNENSSFIISNFIGETLKNLKKHNRFFKCIKKIFELLIYSNFSKIKSIKIKISGKINRSRRTKTKVIQIGNLPVQTIKSNINYSQTTTTHNPNGSIGIKVWVIEK